MNRIAVSVEEIPLPAWAGDLEAYALRVLDLLKKDNWDLSILLCNNPVIRRLNAQYRNREEPTDILSFFLGETLEEEGSIRYLPGDLVVSLETLEENAGYFRVSEDEELRRLIIHGILHLDGMDHPGGSRGDQPMLALQERLLEELAGERILPLESA